LSVPLNTRRLADHVSAAPTNVAQSAMQVGENRSHPPTYPPSHLCPPYFPLHSLMRCSRE
jgi:hypothetical protein